ncbi:MAG: PAS domain S-box protein [Candidatus Cloacimonetes bacterium]|nr:PAS domain S-box protein [Candidatus Cloacimonadota bacterium]
MKPFRMLLFAVVITLLLPNLHAGSNVDSLQAELQQSSGNKKVEILLQLAKSLVNDHPDSSLAYSEQALGMIRENGQPTADFYNVMGDAYKKLGDQDLALYYYNLVLDTIGPPKLARTRADALYSIGLIQENLQNYSKALTYFQEAAQIFQALNISSTYANVLNNIGIIYENLSAYDSALEYYLQAYLLYLDLDDKLGEANTLNNIGNIYMTMGNYDRALENHFRSLSLYREIDDQDGIATAFNNIGIIYHDLDQYETALDYYQRSLEICEQLALNDGIATAMNNMGIVYHNMGNFQEALSCYHISLEKSVELNDFWAMANTNMNMAELYIDFGDADIGAKYLREGSNLARDYSFRDLIMESHKIFAKYHSVKNDYQKAYLQYQLYDAIKDSIFAESSQKIADIQTIYETEQKEKELELFRIRHKHQNFTKIILFAASVFFLLIAIWFWKLYTSKNKEVLTRQALEKNIIRLASIVNQAEESIVMTDLFGNIVYVNSCFEKLTGYTREEVIGKNPNLLQSGQTDHHIYGELWNTIKFNGVWTGNFINKRKDGTLYHESATIFPIKDENGEIINYAAVKRDITEQIKAQKKLTDSEERFRQMAENISDGLSIIEDGQIIYVNQRLCEITGYDRSELMLMDCYQLAAPFEVERIRNICEAAGKNLENLKNLEYWITRKDGEPRYIINGYTHKKKNGNHSIRYIITSDITERKQFEEKIMNSLEEKDVLLKEIHHRVKNNMQVISSLLQLQSRFIKDPQALELFRNSQNRVRSMALIHEKLYRSKDLASIDFGEYVRNLTTHLQIFYAVNADLISLEIDIEDIFFDIHYAIPCGLIINELVSNSLKYAFTDDRKGKIRISIQASSDSFRLEVSDTGIGMPAELDFQNTESLGLQLVMSLIGQLHGKITMQAGNGTTFLIDFPRVEARNSSMDMLDG